VIELHGNIRRTYCVDCGREKAGDTIENAELPECCPECGGHIRPDVVWFGELLPEDALAAAFDAAEDAEVFLVVGTSAEVYPAGGLPSTARRAGAYVVEINVNETAITKAVDECLSGPAGVVLPELVQTILSRRGSNRGTPATENA
jgi:NAD-dependent deacetylase